MTTSRTRRGTARAVLRVVLALFYAVAGVFHLTTPAPFLRIMPALVPAPEVVVWMTGLAELLGAAGLVQPFSRTLRQAAGWGLAVYALAVWPANINHLVMDLARDDEGWSLFYHIPRMAAQPVLIWLALWAGDVTEWPLRQGRQSG